MSINIDLAAVIGHVLMLLSMQLGMLSLKLWRDIMGNCLPIRKTSTQSCLVANSAFTSEANHDNREAEHTSTDPRDHFTGVCFNSKNEGKSVHFPTKK